MSENKSISQLSKELDVNLETGLSEEEAKNRLEKNGPNALASKKKRPLILTFLLQFNDPMIYILIAAAIISGVIAIINKEPDGWADVIIIMAVVILNAVIGTIQEAKAEKALEALKKLASPTTIVKRSGKLLEIKAEDLVVGDVVILEEGRIIPADVRLIEAINLKTDESSLTGESVPVLKDASITFSGEVGVGDRINMAYMSTPAVYGRGEGLVVATGMNTEIGKIAKLLDNEKEEMTPLQKRLAELSKILGIATVVIVVLLFGVTLLQKYCFGVDRDILEMFVMAISLAVAAVPEGLPAVVTIVLALGVQRMVKCNTIVRKLPSVETLGAVSVVCSDKTGTLTQNKMTVVKTFSNGKLLDIKEAKEEDVELLAKGMSLCSNASTDSGIYGDPTEVALVEFANHYGWNKKPLEEKWPRVDEIPFDSVRKMMSTQHSHKNRKIIFTKGALDSILKTTTMIVDGEKERKITAKDLDNIRKASESMSNDALRVLALAFHDDSKINEDNLCFVGLVGMVDPARPEAKPAVALFKSAGITTVMITGDHKDTAFAIAKDLGIASDPTQCVSGDQLNKMSQEELNEVVKTTRVFARVSPENKVMIVKAFKANNKIVAMTGDGVNDAPSVKAADIGIAMGITGTDVAKGAADMILSDDNFASIEKAVEEGRGIYANIKKTVLFLLSSNFAEVLTMFVAICLGLPSPLIAIHILWVNLITDSLPAIALGADAKDKDIMKDKPRDANESLFAHGGWTITIIFGVLIALITFGAFLYLPIAELINTNQAVTLDAIKALFTSNESLLMESQSCAFTVLGLSELFHMIGMTNFNKSFVHIFKEKNWLLFASFLIGLFLQIAVTEIPGVTTFFKTAQLSWIEWLCLVAVASSPLVVHEIIVLFKFITKKIKQKKVTE